MPRTSAPLVGRSAELETLRASLGAAVEGRASVVVLGGDAGVGKTRLLAELVEVAGVLGMQHVVGHCVDLGDAPPPYLPFSEAFARIALDRPADIAALVTSHPAIERLLPGRGSRGVEDRVDRGELFESVLGAFAELAAGQPLVVLIEDVHWADMATRDLLGFLFTRLRSERLSIVVSYRSDDLHRRHPLRRTLAEWARLAAVERIQLDPLRTDDVRALLQSVAPSLVAERDVASILSRADGNAFFAEELAAAAEQCADPQHLPWQLADLLLVRLDRLTDDARLAVRVAAVAGRRVSHAMLAAVIELPADRLDAALRDAIDAHIVELTPSGRGYIFRHALLAEAVYDDLLPGERVRLHAGYAAALATRSDRTAAELARHARASHDYATAYSASVRAGADAMSVAAPQEALQHYEAALDLVLQMPQPPDGVDEVIVDLVEASVAAGRSQRGVAIARAGLASLPADAAPVRRATLLFALASAALGTEIDEEPMSATAEALRLVAAEPPSVFTARLTALHAQLAYVMGREVESQRYAREAIELGNAIGCSTAVTDAQTTLAMLERRVGDPVEAARLLTAAAAAARESGDVASELRSHYSLASLHHERGELARAQEVFELTHQRARETGRAFDPFGMHSRATTGLLQFTRGDWDGALRTADVSTARLPALAEALFASVGMLVRAGRGDRSALDLLPRLREYWGHEGRVGLNAGFGALELYEQSADVEAALSLIDDMVAELGMIWLQPWFLARIQLSAAGIAVLSAAAVSAPQAEHARLAALGAQLADDGRTAAEQGLPPGRMLGIEGRAWVTRLDAEALRLRWLTAPQPDVDELIEAWQRAVDAFDYGDFVQQARTRARLATVLRAAGRGAEAAEQADLARAAARQMGATPLLDEIRLLGTTPAPRPQPDTTGLDALTDRERDVLALLVEARTNRQIATQLYISEKTVSVHVSNILGKLSVRSRAEAAALARRTG
ncbi:AAA family ATPase [Jatrophihabitans sp.]|uniref:helix-turn-helix transcriptional regulator n=1 Tax=Jatrophihabitans sp. TaxID=1932789 RepID=UPI0030C766BE|nr:transcriptional regulator, LuxR family [Jatrophihabitans sp.]